MSRSLRERLLRDLEKHVILIDYIKQDGSSTFIAATTNPYYLKVMGYFKKPILNDTIGKILVYSVDRKETRQLFIKSINNYEILVPFLKKSIQAYAFEEMENYIRNICCVFSNFISNK